MTRQALIIFTRNPVLGSCKTRLAATVGDQVALDIYKKLLQHTASITQELPFDVLVYYTNEVTTNDAWDDTRFKKRVQQGEDLGQKMKNAFIEGFENGYEQLIIIGSDLYDLSTQDLILAFEALENNQVVFGPAQDGGYYLLGLKEVKKAVFKNKKWGTSTVGQETLKDLEGLDVAVLSPRNDIDYFEDLKPFPALMAMVPKELHI